MWRASSAEVGARLLNCPAGRREGENSGAAREADRAVCRGGLLAVDLLDHCLFMKGTGGLEQSSCF